MSSPSPSSSTPLNSTFPSRINLACSAANPPACSSIRESRSRTSLWTCLEAGWCDIEKSGVWKENKRRRKWGREGPFRTFLSTSQTMLATRTLLSQTARRSTSQVSRAGASSILTSTSSSILAAPRFTQPRGAVGQQSRQFSSSRMTMAASYVPPSWVLEENDLVVDLKTETRPSSRRREGRCQRRAGAVITMRGEACGGNRRTAVFSHIHLPFRRRTQSPSYARC